MGILNNTTITRIRDRLLRTTARLCAWSVVCSRLWTVSPSREAWQNVPVDRQACKAGCWQYAAASGGRRNSSGRRAAGRAPADARHDGIVSCARTQYFSRARCQDAPRGGARFREGAMGCQREAPLRGRGGARPVDGTGSMAWKACRLRRRLDRAGAGSAADMRSALVVRGGPMGCAGVGARL